MHDCNFELEEAKQRERQRRTNKQRVKSTTRGARHGYNRRSLLSGHNMRFLLLKYLDLDSRAFEWKSFTLFPSPTDSLAILLNYARRLDAVCYMLKEKPWDASSSDNVEQELESIGNFNALEDVAKGLNPSSTFSSIGVDPGLESDEVRLLVVVIGRQHISFNENASDEVLNIQKVFHARVIRFKTAYPGIIIEAETAGQISFNDVIRNKIFEASQTPEFVSTFIDKVQSALFYDGVEITVANLDLDSRFKGVSSPLLQSHDSQDTGANLEEGVGKTPNNTCPEVLSHLAYVTGFEKPMKFPNSYITQRDADGLFFYRLSRYLLSPEKIGLSSSLQGSWDIPMIVEIRGEHEDRKFRRWTPVSDFSVSLNSIPHIIAEVCSDKVGRKDRRRMLVQGASVVRLVNDIRDTKEFILLAIYFLKTEAECYFLYEEKNTKDRFITSESNSPYTKRKGGSNSPALCTILQIC